MLVEGKKIMTLANMSNPDEMTGAPVNSRDGSSLGKVDAIYYANDTNKPEWAAVKSGLFGGHVSLVPLQDGSWDGNTLTVPFDKEALKSAPHRDPDSELSPTDEEELYSHYGMSSSDSSPTSADDAQHVAEDSRRDRTGEPGVRGHDTSGPTTDDAMTRSEERLRVGTEEHEVGRARLRKHIVTENVTTTIPVSREEVTLEREPITETNRGAALAGEDLSEETHEVTLTEQRPVVDKQTVPVERVRLGTETVTDDQQVDETVRKEVIDTEGAKNPADKRRRGRKN
jgi:uncharacterized protein (TIGR02271 family)